ncbi:adhesion G protein-coupled receptor F5-like [Diretmus argenteus]
MNLDFDPAFNDPDHEMFKEIDAAIKRNSEEFVNGLISASLDRLRSNWTAKWKINGGPITERHKSSKLNGRAILTVNPVFLRDKGSYECLLIERTVFRETGNFNVKPVPVIQVDPVRTNVQCGVGNAVQLICSVQAPYQVQLREGDDTLAQGNAITHNYDITNCTNPQRQLTCEEITKPEFKREITVVISPEPFVCVNDDEFGNGRIGDEAVASCKEDEIGEKTAVCRASTEWEDRQDNCILRVIDDLLSEAQFLDETALPNFLERLSNATLNFTGEVVASPANIGAIVDILSRVADVSSNATINPGLMTDVLITVDILTSDGAKDSWDFLNSNSTTNDTEVESPSSSLLFSIETITNRLSNESFEITTPLIFLNKTTFTDSYSADLNSSVVIDIPESDNPSNTITTITFASMDNVLPARNGNNDTINTINGNVVLVQSSGTITNVSFTFDVFNETLGNPQCVFWNFSLFDGLGGWDDEGCELVSDENENVTCNCNHLTSFSILMSPFIPKDLAIILDFITYIGVAISMGCLVICLIIEAILWRKIRKNSTSYLRHVSIVNIAVSLLIADIWFVIGAAISDEDSDNVPACTAATFFIHFFYLALFFWMLASALLLLYRTVSVFDGGLSEKGMLGIGFSIGYGAPLIIVIITIAVTAPKEQYIRGTGVCWLNWYDSKALLAFVIPALMIVVVNFLILFVVMYKMLRSRSVSARADERHVLLVIARSMAVLTPFFGTTWGLGVGTMTDPGNKGIHIVFAIFNSLQGFFILVFGTLLDKKSNTDNSLRIEGLGHPHPSMCSPPQTHRYHYLRAVVVTVQRPGTDSNSDASVLVKSNGRSI